MADIELVIKMSEELYKTIKKNGYIYEEEVEDVALSIIGGTPLPEGAVILTKEAYSDLCMRAAEGSEKE